MDDCHRFINLLGVVECGLVDDTCLESGHVRRDVIGRNAKRFIDDA